MNSPLQRLYRTKLLLLAVVFAVAGTAALTLPSLTTWSWIDGLPLADLGLTLLGIGLFAIVFEFVDRRDAEERGHEQLRRILREEAPAFRDAVVDGFAFKPESLTNVASPETLDRVIRNCLGLRLGDSELAAEVYSDVREQVVRAGSRNYSAQVSVALTPWEHGPPSLDGKMFAATIRWQYEVAPLSPVMRFSCVSDEDEYRKLLQDPSSTTTWYFKPVAGLDGASMDAFELVQFAVDGVEQKIRRTSRAGIQTYTVHPGRSDRPSDGRTSVSYTFRALVRRHGNLLHLDIARPTKGLNVELFYGGCGIESVKVLDYIASSEQPRISQLPASAPAPSVSLAFDGWVWPKGGIGFVWMLEDSGGGKADPPRK